MSKYKLFILAIMFCCFATSLRAQWQLPNGGVREENYNIEKFDTLALPKWEPHLYVGTGFMGTNRGDNRIYSTVMPSLTFRPSDKWAITGGFSFTSDLGLNPYYSFESAPKSLAPYKRNGGTSLASGYVSAEYHAGENVWLSASLYHQGGTYAPIYGFANGNAFDVSVTAINAEAAFRFKNNNFLILSFTMIKDNVGTLPYMMYDSWHHGGFGPWGMYASSFDYYRMSAPCGMMCNPWLW